MNRYDQGSTDCISSGEGVSSGMGDGCARDTRTANRWWRDRSTGLRHDG